jgi:prevent-host-death family protein
MIEISVKEARGNLSALLHKVEHGEEITITRHGKKIARLVPPVKGKNKNLPSLAGFRSAINLKGKPLSQTVIGLRNTGRY